MQALINEAGQYRPLQSGDIAPVTGRQIYESWETGLDWEDLNEDEQQELEELARDVNAIALAS